ncbi:MAG: ABC transporter substrate-binding protein, partial [Patescibacteria group bacterium]|nr:ABC transporter substrate-binding protein [Patescibacteria group bacterium]
MRSFWRTASRLVYLPFIDKAEDAYRAFAASGRALFLFFSALLVISAGVLLFMLNGLLLEPTPAHGGTLTEGILGAPRFINPVLAVSDADRDLTALIYSGLLKPTSSGNYEPNLTSRYEVSEDGRVYTFFLREDATFHDGESVTAHDVVFTITKIKDPSLKSPAHANWEGVTVEVLDDRTVRFTLVQPYAPFIKNATVGILPKHLWEEVNVEEFPFSELNTLPIGSGAFKVDEVSRTTSGILSSYELQSFTGYTLGQPYLARIHLNFYQNEEALLTALSRGEIEAVSGISPALLPALPKNHTERSSLNRVFGIFFNQNESAVLREAEVRKALDMAVDREALVANILGGYGTPLTGPVPPGVVSSSVVKISSPAGDPVQRAREYLLSQDWEVGVDGTLFKTVGSGDDKKTLKLSFTVSTGNVAELRAAAEFVKSAW